MGVTFDSVSSSVKQEAGQLEEPGVDECRWWDRTRVHLASDSRARRWGLTVVRIRHLSPLTWVQFFLASLSLSFLISTTEHPRCLPLLQDGSRLS